jgi:hypothetical protein
LPRLERRRFFASAAVQPTHLRAFWKRRDQGLSSPVHSGGQYES